MHEHVTGSENMSGYAKLCADPFDKLERLTGVLDHLQQFQSLARILFGVERQRRQVLCDLVPIAIVGFFFLQARGIGQKNLEQVSRAARTINWSAKALIDQPR